LREVAAEIPLVLRVVSAGRPRLAGVPLEAVAWSRQGEAAEIARFDVGVMPLPDDEWSRGKCALKILQCFAAGVPVVASPVGMNADLIEDDRNGLLAASAADWARQVRRLALDPQLRLRLGREGRRTLEKGFSMSDWAPRIAALWQEVARRGAAGRKRFTTGGVS
ncbi:MAG: glycosyltransferase, partial [Planctomycetes bacterium]|nr:glycosyltransferase [Planctomycetota bacterium]